MIMREKSPVLKSFTVPKKGLRIMNMEVKWLMKELIQGQIAKLW
jgi:hypothetical protein